MQLHFYADLSMALAFFCEKDHLKLCFDDFVYVFISDVRNRQDDQLP